MTYVIEVLRQEHRNIEKLLQVLDRELTIFDRGDRPEYEVIVRVFDYFQGYPDSCHHPKEDMIFDKLKSRDPAAASKMGDLRIEHEEEARRLRRAAQAVYMRYGKGMHPTARLNLCDCVAYALGKTPQRSRYSRALISRRDVSCPGSRGRTSCNSIACEKVGHCRGSKRCRAAAR